MGIGAGEFTVLIVVLVLVVGPKEMPKLVRSFAKFIREFRKASNEVRDSVGIDKMIREEELKELREMQRLARERLQLPESPSTRGTSSVRGHAISSGSGKSNSKSLVLEADQSEPESPTQGATSSGIDAVDQPRKVPELLQAPDSIPFAVESEDETIPDLAPHAALAEPKTE
ncbi:MAG: twin-arginine translocase TatA/TatE family subunit [Myxococcota bacterium]